MSTSISFEPRGGRIRVFSGFSDSNSKTLNVFCRQIGAIKGVVMAVAHEGKIWIEVKHYAAWGEIDPKILHQIFTGRFVELSSVS